MIYILQLCCFAGNKYLLFREKEAKLFSEYSVVSILLEILHQFLNFAVFRQIVKSFIIYENVVNLKFRNIFGYFDILSVLET